MSESGPDGGGLERLFDDMLRDGWLSGMDDGLDVVMARMDKETGVYNRKHFEGLADRAIGDKLHGRERRAGDGPAEGNVAVLAIRIDNWAQLASSMTAEEEVKVVTRVGDAMKGAFRVDDVIGRLREDVFALLLRGCPLDMLDVISERCLADLGEVRVPTSEGWLVIDARAYAETFDGEGTGESLVSGAIAGFSE